MLTVHLLTNDCLVQGLQTLWKFEKDWLGRPELRLSQGALDTCEACIDTFGRCMSTTALTKQMAVLEPVSDHAFSLPVRPRSCKYHTGHDC